MTSFLPNRAFTEVRGKIYFHRDRGGPTYEVTAPERDDLTALMHRLHFQMATTIFVFALVLAVGIVLLPVIVTLNTLITMFVLVLMVALALLPFILMAKFHIDFQKDIRQVLGTRTAVDFVLQRKPKTPEELARETIFRFAGVFLIGIILASLGATILVSADYLPFRLKLVWTMCLVTGVTLIGVGIAGLVMRLKTLR